MLQAVCGETDLAKAGIDLVVKTHDNIRPIGTNRGAVRRVLRLLRGHADVLRPRAPPVPRVPGVPRAARSTTTPILTIDGTRREPRAARRQVDLDDPGRRCRRPGQRARRGAVTPNSVGAHVRERDAATSASARSKRATRWRSPRSAPTASTARPATTRSICSTTASSSFALRPTRDGLHYLDAMAKFCPHASGAAAHAGPLRPRVGLPEVRRGDHRARRPRSSTSAPAGSHSPSPVASALNCVANTKILEQTPFERALRDARTPATVGSPLGAALYGYHVVLGGKERHPPAHDYLGRAASEAEIVDALDVRPRHDVQEERRHRARVRRAHRQRTHHRLGAGRRRVRPACARPPEHPRRPPHASRARSGSTARSSAASGSARTRRASSPSTPTSTSRCSGPSPYMLLAVNTRPEVRDKVPGIVHVDGSARVQTVERDIEPLYHRLISKFHEITGVPLVLNTSFNGYGEPMVETPRGRGATPCTRWVSTRSPSATTSRGRTAHRRERAARLFRPTVELAGSDRASSISAAVLDHDLVSLSRRHPTRSLRALSRSVLLHVSVANSSSRAGAGWRRSW